MTAAKNVRKNFNLFVDGKGYAGQVEEFTPPKLSIKTEEFRAGGMEGPVELSMGLEKLEASFSLVSYDRDVLSLFGVAEGSVVPFTLREALEDFDGTITSVVHNLRGKIKSIDQGTVKAGDKVGLKVDMAVTYYKVRHGNADLIEIDVENMVRSVNGNDALASMRAALGM